MFLRINNGVPDNSSTLGIPQLLEDPDLKIRLNAETETEMLTISKPVFQT